MSSATFTQPLRQGTGRFLAGLILITAVAVGIRQYRLAGPSMWVDELFTVKWSIGAATGMTDARALAYTPTALAYRLLGIDIADLDPDSYAGWIAAGVTEERIRIPSVVVGVLSVLLLGWLSRRMLGDAGALMLALLLAISSWHVWGSQTARFYAQQFLLYNLSFTLYYVATRRPSRWAMLGAAVFMVLAFLTQLTSLLLIVVFGIDWLVGMLTGEPRRWGRWGWACLGVATVACLAYYKLRVSDVIGSVAGFAGSRHSVKDIMLGFPFLVGVPVAGVAVLAVAWLLREARGLGTLLLAGMVVPLVGIAAFGALGVDIHVRYTYVGLYAWLAATAIGLVRIYELVRARASLYLALVPTAVVLAGMLLATFVYFQGADGYRPRWREAFAHISARRAPGELVAADYIPRLVGSYYLQMDAQDIIQLTSRQTYEQLLEKTAGRPTWVVVRGVSATGGPRFLWLQDRADLKAYFATQTFQPYSSVHVYHLNPR